MFIISLTYTAPLAKIDARLAAHREWLGTQYKAGIFLMSGAKVPRDGGIILARAPSRGALERILSEDPFALADLARYEITEFTPTMTAEAFDAWRGV